MPFIKFYDGLVHVSKNRYGSPNRNQREINENRGGSAGFKLFRFRWEWNVSLIFTCVTGQCEAKDWRGCSCHICGVCRGHICEKLNPVNPAEPQLSCRAPVFCNRNWAFIPHNNRRSSPFPSLVLEGFILLIIIPLSWIIPILHSGWRVPAGHDCRHRWSRPVMASICHCALASVLFLCCFSFCLSSLSLFFSWKCPFGT